ncbi:hypothetical protein GYMLUDRAFT_49266 [Collybiopsis luxurians FD-317 M1]|uniref:Uncharacterized protein n=1 Tax=Collybiopsis luxurians FD-317 M1 TaxID=944289 RepID=A0A0D0BVN5_9AGAR|nr:hypothetical protein GYMLUDRAFT_49266 [Collybiopsis luxurians FD-317 M1]
MRAIARKVTNNCGEFFPHTHPSIASCHSLTPDLISHPSFGSSSYIAYLTEDVVKEDPMQRSRQFGISQRPISSSEAGFCQGYGTFWEWW